MRLLSLAGLLIALAGISAPAFAQEATPQPSPSAVASPTAAPGTQSSPAPSASPCPLPNPLPTLPVGVTPGVFPLCPAVPSGNPVDLLAWVFTPIFQGLFLGLAAFYVLFGDIGIAIVLLTIVIKTLLIPLFKRQIVAQRRMQMLQPELRVIQQKFKGNRAKISEETMRLYRERGVNPAAGCLPTLLQLFLLIPIYSVISQGLASTDISPMLHVFGQQLLNVPCQVSSDADAPCIDPTIWWLGGIDAHVPRVVIHLPFIIDPKFGISDLAVVAAVLQLVQSRMMMQTTADPTAQSTQRVLLWLPLISVFYGWFLPAGLFIYWIVFTAYSILQQYLIAGFGQLFPLFGWTPAFARDHQPRFAVQVPAPKRAQGGDSRETTEPMRSPSDSAAGTIRPSRQKARTSRRGRRR